MNLKDTYTFGGECAANGSPISLSIPGANPSSKSCNCVLGEYSCPPIQFTVLPEAPLITATLASASDSDSPSVSPEVNLMLDPSGTNAGDSIVIIGSCFPDKASSVIFSGSFMTPTGDVTCDCSNSMISNCLDSSSVPVTSVSFSASDTVNTVMTLTNGSMANDTDSISYTAYTVDLNPPSNIINGMNTFTGSCSPDGAGQVGIEVEGANGAAICTCNSGAFSCNFNITNVPSGPVKVTATVGGDKASDDETVDVTPAVNLVLDQTGTSAGDAISISGSCFADELSSVVFNAPSMTPSGNVTCDCTNSLIQNCKDSANSSITSVSFSGSSTVSTVMTISSGATTNDTDTITYSPTYSISINPKNIAKGSNTFSGSCSPDGSTPITINIPGSTFVGSPTCTNCNSGTYQCTANVESAQNGSTVITSTLGSESADMLAKTLPEVDLILDQGSTSPGDSINIAGSCFGEGSDLIVFSGSNMTPSGNITCDCASNLISNCRNSSNSVVTNVSFSASDTINTVMTTSIGQVANDSDSITYTAAEGVIDLNSNYYIVKGSNTFSGSCGPDNSDPINLSIPGASPSTATCSTCSGGAFTCNVNIISAQNDITNITVTKGASITDTEVVKTIPEIDLILDQGSTSAGDNINISGTCFAEGQDNITFSGSNMSPSGVVTCNCVNNLISNCRDSSLNVIASVSFSASDTVSSQIQTTSGESALDSDSISYSSNTAAEAAMDDIFGSHAPYFEDGNNGFCLKLSSTELACKDVYSAADGDWSSMLPSGVTIEGVDCLESSCFVSLTNGEIYSFGTDASAPTARTGNHLTPTIITFPTPVIGSLKDVQGHHHDACLHFDSGQLWCFNEDNAPVLRFSDVKSTHGGVFQHCYIDNSDDLYCSPKSSNEVPYSTSPSLIASGVLSFTSNHNHSGVNFGGLVGSGGDNSSSITQFLNGDIYTGTQSTVGSQIPGVSVTGVFYRSVSVAKGFLDQTGELWVNDVKNTSMGTGNLGVGQSMKFTSTAPQSRFFVLSSDNKLYYDILGADISTSSLFVGGFTDVIGFRAFSNAVCLLRSNNEIYCADGSGQGGLGGLPNPNLFGTYVP